jgi:malate dehydrogenase
VLVVGNPANTNALITRAHARDIPADRFTAMMRLDHNHAVSQIARHLAVSVDAVRNVTIWGNHSSTQYPDLSHAEVNGKKVSALVDQTWTRDAFTPTVGGRGAAVINARGASSAASAANAAIDHVHDWIHGTRADTWTSAAVVSDGSYRVPEGLVSGFPVVSRNGRYEIVQGLQIDQHGRDNIDQSVAELLEEQNIVVKHGLLPATT